MWEKFYCHIYLQIVNMIYMWWIIWDWLEMEYESICGWNEIAMTIEIDMNCYDICWKVWLVCMRMIRYIRGIMWNGYDYWNGYELSWLMKVWLLYVMNDMNLLWLLNR